MPPWSSSEAGTRPSKYTAQIFYEERQRLTNAEILALEKFRPGHTIAARKIAEKILQRRPQSSVAHFLLYFALRNDEGELIRSLWHLRQAMAYYKSTFFVSRSRTHHMMLIELISVLRQLGRDKESFKWINFHDRVYSIYRIKFEEFRPWVLMKMRRYKQARAEALNFLKKKKYTTTALNSLCAISFERNHRQESLKYCKLAYLADKKRPTNYNRSIHSINLAEAQLSLFHLAKAEQYAFQATRHFHRDLHSTPWEFLLGLYLDQGRYNDAWNALKKAKRWFLSQSPKLSESVYASNQLAQSCFLLTVARPEAALKVLERIRDRPDRHGHMSARTRQFVAGARLLRRHALLMAAETTREKAAPRNIWFRMFSWTKTLWLRFRAWRQGALLRRQMADPAFLHNSISPYRSGSLSMPNSSIPHWYTADLIPIMGPAIIRKALEHVRSQEAKNASLVKPFLQTMEAEIAFVRGEYKRARAFGEAALTQLPRSLLPLHIRIHTILGAIARYEGRFKVMRSSYALALQRDGSVFRRLQFPLPVTPSPPSSARGQKVMNALLRSPRFSQEASGFILQVRSQGPVIRVLLTQRNGTILSRVTMHQSQVKQAKPKLDPHRKTGKTTEPRKTVKQSAAALQKLFIEQLLERVHRDLFAPPVQLSRQDIYSLDGTPLQTRQPSLKLPFLLKEKKTLKP